LSASHRAFIVKPIAAGLRLPPVIAIQTYVWAVNPMAATSSKIDCSLGRSRQAGAQASIVASRNNMKINIERKLEEARVGWILLWLLGVPIPVLLILFLLRGCT
jgi:hypothetical protein